MRLHPYCEIWRVILDHTGLRARDVAKASGIPEATLSRWLRGHRWPNRTSTQKMHRALECLLNRQEGAVDKLVDNMRITGGRIGDKLFEDLGAPVIPSLIPVIIHRPAKRKAQAGPHS